MRRRENPDKYRGYEKTRYWRDREKRTQRRKEWYRANKAKAYELARKTLARVEAIKTATPCMDCGGTFPPECFDFDHRPGETKTHSVGYLVATRYSWPRIEAEIAKCDVVCANCHRIRTKVRHQERREANACI
jgi:hypothetical protein